MQKNNGAKRMSRASEQVANSDEAQNTTLDSSTMATGGRVMNLKKETNFRLARYQYLTFNDGVAPIGIGHAELQRERSMRDE